MGIRLRIIRLRKSSSGVIRLRVGIRLRTIRLRKSSSGVIRLRVGIRLRTIRLRDSSSGGNSSSLLLLFVHRSNVEFVFVIRLRLRVEKWYPHSGRNVYTYIYILCLCTLMNLNALLECVSSHQHTNARAKTTSGSECNWPDSEVRHAITRR